MSAGVPNTPEFLTGLPRWGLWREVSVKGAKTKIPLTIQNLPASSTRDSDWTEFSTVVDCRQRNSSALFDGLAIRLGDLGDGWYLVGGDLDSCLDEDGAPSDWASPFLVAAPTYTETSPGGRGLKLFGRCKAEHVRPFLDRLGVKKSSWGTKRAIPGLNGAGHGPAVEIYCAARYFTVTGNQWPGAPDEVAILDEAMLDRLARLVPKGSSHASDDTSPPGDADNNEEIDLDKLREKLGAALRRRRRLRERWAGSTDGLSDTSRSAFDFSLGAMLKAAGFSRAEMREALIRNKHGAGNEKADAGDQRYFDRIWENVTVESPGTDGEGEDHAKADDGETADRQPDIGDPPPGIEDPGYVASVDADVDASPADALISAFNCLYMVVSEAGKAIIYEPTYDAILNRRYYKRIPFDDLRKLYLNKRICVGRDDKGKQLIKPAADFWLNHPDRRQFIGGVVFDPSCRHASPDMLNLWQGFAVKPRHGSWKRLQDHILLAICAHNIPHCEWLIGWMARLVQRPAEQGEVAVVLKGIEGCGKGTLARALLYILGQHGLAISNAKHLIGNFNGHLHDAVLLFADEAFFAGDRAHVGVLKALITEKVLTIEAKYKNPVQMPNYVHLMMASNEDWVVPASLEARRFFVLEVLATHANDTAYFAAIWNEMENGGYEAMLHDLLAYDISSFNHRAAPKTDGLQTQKKLSLPTAEAWWLEALHRGYVHESRLGLEDHFSQWHEQLATEILFKAYEAFAKAHGDRRPLNREVFGRFMGRIGGNPIRPRNVATGEHIADVENPYGGTSRKAKLVMAPRAHGYALGDLEAARVAFEQATGVQVEWP